MKKGTLIILIIIVLGLFFFFILKPILKYQSCKKEFVKEFNEFSHENTIKITPDNNCTYAVYYISILGNLSSDINISSNDYKILLKKGKIDTLIKHMDYYGTYNPEIKIYPNRNVKGRLLIKQTIE
ncbi:MAG: hypothetical protein ACRC0E_05625 [Soonwooa sp.]